MRILHVITRFVRGGADENTLLTCNYQAEEGHDVTLMFGRESHPDILRELHPAVKKVSIAAMGRAIHPLDDARSYMSIRRYLRDFAPDVVHTHTSKAGILGRLAAIHMRIPIIVHGVHILPFLGVGRAAKHCYRLVERIVARETDYFIDVSEGMRSASLDHGIGSAENHVVIPSGMDIDAFRRAQAFSPEELAAELGMATAPKKLIVSAAVLEPRKRHLEFLEILPQIVDQHPGTHFVVAGEGPLAGAIQAKSLKLGISHNVHLIGFRADVARWMKSADVCTLASEREGLPRTVIQYVLCGRPVVATKLPGIGAVARDGDNAVVVDRPDQMAAPINAILRDEGLAARMAARSAAIDLSDWNATSMVRRIDEVYEVVSRSKGIVPSPLSAHAAVS